MVKHPIAIICFLLAIEFVVLRLSRGKRLAKFFDIVSPVFWIYFLPMLSSTLGLIDPQAPILGAITTNLLPASLLLLLMTVDMAAILRLGGKALGMFFIGSAGMIVGAVISFAIFSPFVGARFWGGFGALSASWTGGSANMIAVKEALSVPDDVFLPMVVVDTVVPYLWMGFLIAAVRWQDVFDRWNRSDRKVIDDLRSRTADQRKKTGVRFSPLMLVVLLAIAALGSILSQLIAVRLPVVKDVFSTYAWTIIVVSGLGLALSFTPARRLEAQGATRLGYFILYFVLTAIGARAALSNIGSAFLLITAGLVIVLVHAGAMLAGARILKAPLFLVAAASQANIGGVASAPVVAAVYEPGLASVGLLLAILGNIIGTYLGILCAQLCRLFT
jgi:uncharacterized membrane protein